MGPKKSYSFKLVGLVKDAFFHMGKAMLEDIKLKYGGEVDISVEIIEHLEFDWRHFVQEVILNEKGEMWMFKENVMLFNDGTLLGGLEQFQQFFNEEFQYSNYRPLSLYEAMADEAYKKYFADKHRDVVYFDVTINDISAGRLLMELFNDKCPKTCYNFKCLCTGEKGRSEETGIKLHYQGSILHRVVKNGWVQGGDIDLGKGNGGYSIYGPQFEDESFAVPHDRRGVLSMANHGRHSNRSQFFLTFQKCGWMDKKYVAFGRVVEGFDVLNNLEALETFNERPKRDCVIENCGVFYDSEVAAKAALAKEEERKMLAIQLASTHIVPKTVNKEEVAENTVSAEPENNTGELMEEKAEDVNFEDLAVEENKELDLEENNEEEKQSQEQEVDQEEKKDLDEEENKEVDEENNKELDALEQVAEGAPLIL